ncbi:MAG: hypothetical protein ACKVPY_16510 [Paracoccaceae bacterium]
MAERFGGILTIAPRDASREWPVTPERDSCDLFGGEPWLEERQGLAKLIHKAFDEIKNLKIQLAVVEGKIAAQRALLREQVEYPLREFDEHYDDTK